MNETDRAAALFDETVSLGAAERAAFLDRACAGDAVLRGRVEALLRAHDRAGHFLDRPNAPSPGTVDHTPASAVGTVIARRYKLLEVIGEGGMGAVWMAEQREPVKRLVALKLIKAGMDSRAVLARFEAERQALALMDHPNIAKVLDGGSLGGEPGEPGANAPGSPYFVMELVKGLPLTEYCDERRLSVSERLQLFVPICQAVQHAHQKGIIHRDLKPSNILVTEHDGQPVPKVIDFGLAKALGVAAPLTERTLHTAYGTVVGTPLYMAPEQVGINALDVDTRTDIYALGTILYELLTGTTPLEKRRFKEAAWDEIRRLIREEEPPRPSLRLSSSDALPTLAARRQTEPAKLSRLVKGDLDWIVLKALEKDRNRRYETANGLALDVQRHLAGEPVLAAPPSVSYRLRKFLRKRRGPVLAAALVLLALVGGIAGTTWGLLAAVSQRDAADEARAQEVIQRRDAEANARKAAAAAQEETRQRRIAEANEKKAAAAADQERQAREREAEQRKAAVAAQQRAMEALRATTDDVIDQLLASRPVLGPTEKAFLEATLKRWLVFATEKGDSPEARAIRFEGLQRVATLRYKLGEWQAALADCREAIGLQEQLVAEFPAMPGYRRSLANGRNNLGVLLDSLGKRAEAEKQHRQALGLRAKLAADFPAVPARRQELAKTHNILGELLLALARWVEAEEQFRQALDLHEKLATEFPAVPAYRQGLASNHSNLGSLLQKLGKRAEAERQHREALGLRENLAADFPAFAAYRLELAGSRRNLGILLKDIGKLAEALDQLRQALDLQKKLATEFPAVPAYRHALAGGHYALGLGLNALGKFAGAEEQYRLAQGLQEKLVAEQPAVPEIRKDLARTCLNLAIVLEGLEKHTEAEEQFRQALALEEKLVAEFPAFPAYRQDLANSRNGLANLLVRLGKLAEAEPLYRQALALQEQLAVEFPSVPGYRLDLARSHNNLGALLKALRKGAEAENQYRLALGLREKLVADFPAVAVYRREHAGTYNNLGVLLRALGKPLEADEQHRLALALQQKLVADFPNVPGYRQDLAFGHHQRAGLLHALGKLREAEEQHRQALSLREKLAAEEPAVPAYRQELGNSHHELGIVLYGLGKGAEAVEQLRQALGLQEKLAADFPAVTAYRIDVGRILLNFGQFALGSGKPADSLDWYARAIAAWTPVVKQEPGLALALRTAHGARALALDQLGRHEEAAKDWDQAAALSPTAEQRFFKARLALSQAKAGQVAAAVAEVAQLTRSPQWTAANWYDFARVYALASAGDKDRKEEYAVRAVELLQRAIQAGYNNAEQLKKDADLQSLRGRDDFGKLIESLTKTKNPAPR
jgi:serine/threonine protein kinase